MSFGGRVLELYLRRLDRRLRGTAADPGRYQRRLLDRIVGRASDTWFGREHDFASIRSHADFAKAVPITDYAARADLFDRIFDGEPNVCWPGWPGTFARTSGTTAGLKRIPVTRGTRRNQVQGGLSILALLERSERGLMNRIMDGKIVFMGGARTPRPTETGGQMGSMASFSLRWIPWPIRSRYEPPPEIGLIEDYEEKTARVVERLYQADVRFFAHNPSWAKLVCDRVCKARGFDAEGGISRAWPNLAVFVHGGMNFEPLRPTFERYFHPEHRVRFMEVYPATEGFIGIQSDLGRPGMEMLVDNEMVFEFVALEDWGKPDAPRLLVDEVETGVPYCLAISTSAGLWSYDLGDVLRFVSLRPPKVLFAGRHKLFMNAFGEHMIGEEFAGSVAAAARATGSCVGAFTVAPLYWDPEGGREQGAHQYIVEFEGEPPADLETFAREIDAKAQELNRNYWARRKENYQMKLPEVTVVPPGTFFAWFEKRGTLGGQYKVPECANDRRVADELLSLAAERQTR